MILPSRITNNPTSIGSIVSETRRIEGAKKEHTLLSPEVTTVRDCKCSICSRLGSLSCSTAAEESISLLNWPLSLSDGSTVRPSLPLDNLYKLMSQDTVPQEDEVTVAVMGPTGSGKTSFINIVSGSNLRVGKSLQSCTSTVQVAPPFQLGDRWVTLIDTPGFDDTTRSDTEILTQIAAFLAAAYESGKKLAGVVYMHRISDVRMGGISTRNFKMFRQLCGESTLRNVVIVTNMWGEVLHEVGEAREAELAGDGRFFKAVLDKGARMLRHYNNAASATAILHYLIGNQPRALRIQRELVDQGKDILQTAAGGELNRELNAQIERHRQEMVKLQHDLQEAIREKDEETKKELEIETGKLQAEMIRVQNDSRKLASEYTQQRVELEKRMTQVAEAAKKEAEIAEENHRRQIEELLEAFQQTSSSAESEREKIRRQLTELQQQYEEVQSRRKGGRGILGNLAWILDAILNF